MASGAGGGRTCPGLWVPLQLEESSPHRAQLPARRVRQLNQIQLHRTASLLRVGVLLGQAQSQWGAPMPGEWHVIGSPVLCPSRKLGWDVCSPAGQGLELGGAPRPAQVAAGIGGCQQLQPAPWVQLQVAQQRLNGCGQSRAHSGSVGTPTPAAHTPVPHPPPACPGPERLAALGAPAHGLGTGVCGGRWAGQNPGHSQLQGPRPSALPRSCCPPALGAAGHKHREGTHAAPASSQQRNPRRWRARVCVAPAGPGPGAEWREHGAQPRVGMGELRGVGWAPTWGRRKRWQCAGCPSRPARPTACT